MEGGGPHVGGLRAQHLFQAGHQLVGSLVCEGDGDDLPGGGHVQRTQALRPLLILRGTQAGVALHQLHILLRHIEGDFVAVSGAPEFQQGRDPAYQHCGLAAARACQDQERAFGGFHRFQLLGIKICPGVVYDLPPCGKKAFIQIAHNFSFSSKMGCLLQAPHSIPFLRI